MTQTLTLRETYLPYISETSDSKGWQGSDGHLYLRRDLGENFELRGYKLIKTRKTKYGTNYYYEKEY